LSAAVILLAVVLGIGAVAFVYSVNKWYAPTEGRPSKSPPALETKTPKARADKSSSPIVQPTPSRVPNLTGEWNMVNTIEKTSYPAFAGLRLGYRLVINQTGTEFTAEGEKVSENERAMAAAERTPIHVTGWVDLDGVGATFVEEGLRRKTSGRFAWTVTADGNYLRGTFVTTAAKSGGSSVATRER